MGRSLPSSLDLSVLGRGNASTFLYGESRPVVNRLLYAMARAVDPNPIWVDLGPGSLGRGEDAGPVELGWVPHERLILAWDVDRARPQNAVGNMALSSVVRTDEPSDSVARLADFVRLAPIAQEVISRVDARAPRRALAVANSDRVRGDYPNTVDGVRPIVTALVEAPLCPLFGAQGVPGPGRMAFSYVFEVRAKDVVHWEDGTLRIEKAPPGSSSRVGHELALADITGVRAVFETGPGSGQNP
ncbi:MAG TPA: hypothetical protein VEG66_01520 [Thermoplasmata archaeon]|jgi:hypothetical protein|nr:hypothetical protein [Thermoplasmata archaeon]